MAIFLLLLLVLAFSTKSMAAPPSCPSQTLQYYGLGLASSRTMQYDELLLALQWPTSFCNRGIICDYRPPPPRFTVHGLWHNLNSKSVDCNVDHSIKLVLQIGSPLWKDMEEHWPNLRSKKHPEDLWIHEYRKHGHCFEDFRKQEAYFRTALNIEKAIGDVMKMRLSKGEILRRGKLYHYNQFKRVTIADQTLTPRLRCNTKPGSKDPQLHEIIFCSDRQKNLKNCTFDFDHCHTSWTDEEGNNMRGFFKFP